MKIEVDAGKKIRQLSTDTNNDGKPDVTDIFSEHGGVLERREDRNYDGKTDRTTFFPQNPGDKQIIHSDNNFDGKIDHIEEHAFEGEFVVITIKIDKKFNGKFETLPTIRSSLIEKKLPKNAIPKPTKEKELTTGVNNDEPVAPIAPTPTTQAEASDCSDCWAKINPITRSVLSTVTGLAPLLQNQNKLGPLDGDFYFTNFGFKLQKACIDAFGEKKFVGMVSETLKKGLSCQWELGSQNSRLNVHKMASLMEDQRNPPKILCDPDKYRPYNWENTYGHASLGRGVVNHPFISLNPNWIKMKSQTDAEWENTIFHELFHNIGYAHTRTHEFAYTCPTCCLSSNSTEKKNLACKLCKGNYLSTTNRQYLKDLYKFMILDDQDSTAGSFIESYLENHPKDRWALSRLIEANTFIDPPFAVAYAEIFKKRYPSLKTEEAKLIAATKQLDNSKEFGPLIKLFSSANQNLSEGFLHFLDGNTEKAKDFLLAIDIPKYKKESGMSESDYKNFVKKLNNRKNKLATQIYEIMVQVDKAKAARIYLEILNKK